MKMPPTTTIATANPTADARTDFIIFLLCAKESSGDASPDSDLDVAVILAGESIERYPEKMALADVAYDAIVETRIHVQA
jgi:hypothetical protein